MSKEDKVKDFSTKSPDAAAQAREQAKVYKSIFAPTTLKLDDGYEIEVPPHPNLRMFDDDAQAAYEALEFELESYDRHPDQPVPEQKVFDKETKQLITTLPPTVQPGPLKVPHRKTNPETGEVKLMNPPYTVQVVKIALGDEGYARLRAGTINGKRGSAAEIWRIWNQQGQDVAERRSEDSKSDAGAVDSSAVPAPDPS